MKKQRNPDAAAFYATGGLRWPLIPHTTWEPDEKYTGHSTILAVDAQAAIDASCPPGQYVPPWGVRYLCKLWCWSAMWGWT